MPRILPGTRARRPEAEVRGSAMPLTDATDTPSKLLTVDDTEALTVQRARNGDLEAFRSIVERHSADVFRVAFRITRSEADAEDVVQDTFFKAYGELPRFEARSALRTWLHRIAANCAIDL